jgi:hypothetical protein
MSLNENISTYQRILNKKKKNGSRKKRISEKQKLIEIKQILDSISNGSEIIRSSLERALIEIDCTSICVDNVFKDKYRFLKYLRTLDNIVIHSSLEYYLNILDTSKSIIKPSYNLFKYILYKNSYNYQNYKFSTKFILSKENGDEIQREVYNMLLELLKNK